jgi:hypothetical protein
MQTITERLERTVAYWKQLVKSSEQPIIFLPIEMAGTHQQQKGHREKVRHEYEQHLKKSEEVLKRWMKNDNRHALDEVASVMLEIA